MPQTIVSIALNSPEKVVQDSNQQTLALNTILQLFFLNLKL